MRKKLDTRFPAARIKKIMQADEDVGKIALAVPVLVSKALELFLQDLCDRTYEITLMRGAKTMSAVHLKNCVQNYNVFDFLREIVSRVPDYSHGHSDATGDHRNVLKRKPCSDDGIDSDEESKRSKMQEASHPGGGGRGKGRGRGRGRGRGARNLEKESSLRDADAEQISSVQQSSRVNHAQAPPAEENVDSKESTANSHHQRNFDLNAEVEKEDTKPTVAVESAAPPAAASVPHPEAEPQDAENHEEYPGWSVFDMDKMAIDPLQLAQLGAKIDEDEDYDEED